MIQQWLSRQYVAYSSANKKNADAVSARTAIRLAMTHHFPMYGSRSSCSSCL